jgi:hypothetical protein
MQYMEANRAAVVEEVRRRWRERDPEPFLPPFAGKKQGGMRSKKGSSGRV